MYIDNREDLAALVSRLRKSPVVAIDTEFMREKTYYARLCLLQLATHEECAIVDPLAIDDISVLKDLFTDADVLKVFHAGSQDLEIMHQDLGVVPTPVFDTQVAATVLGYPQQIGYGNIVKSELSVSLEKGESFTDWAKRPLTDKQLEYAADDVRYLIDVYESIKQKLEREHRASWLAPEFERMEDPKTYEIDPDTLYKRVKRYNSLSRRSLGVLRELARWREGEAQRRDIPRKWVISDESLIEVARRMPDDVHALKEIRGVGEKLNPAVSSGILAAVVRGQEVPEDQLPRIPKRPNGGSDSPAVVDLMMAIVRLRAKEHGISAPLLASRDELTALALGVDDGLEVLSGWRRGIVGEDLLDLLRGNIALSVKDLEVSVEQGERGLDSQ